MDISIDSLISFDALKTDLEHIFDVVEEEGEVVLLKDNKPTYIILKLDSGFNKANLNSKSINLTLHEAMKIVLSDSSNGIMHASKLADEIYNRKLYLQKDGKKAQYNQIRARCGHYPDLFQALPGNHIKLIEKGGNLNDNDS